MDDLDSEPGEYRSPGSRAAQVTGVQHPLDHGTLTPGLAWLRLVAAALPDYPDDAGDDCDHDQANEQRQDAYAPGNKCHCTHILGRCPALDGGRQLIQFHRRSEEHTSELQSRGHLVCRLLL